MACFLVSAAEAVVVTVAASRLEKKEKARETAPAACEGLSAEPTAKIPFSRKLKWLRNLLWGGVALLAFEHVWHGEVVPWFPFLTAMESPEDTADMFREMATVGVSMCIVVTAVWCVVCAVSGAILRRSDKAAQEG